MENKSTFKTWYDTASGETSFLLHLINVPQFFNGTKNMLSKMIEENKEYLELLDIPVVRFQNHIIPMIVDEKTKLVKDIPVTEILLDYKVRFNRGK